jgi:hypothetical protein
MRDNASVSRGCGFVLTNKGREALADEAICDCFWEFDGALVLCHKCDTIYAVVRSTDFRGQSRLNDKRP